MKNKYTQKQKDKVIERYRCGEKGSEISKETNIPKTTIYGWIWEYESNMPKHDKAIDFKKYHELETKYLTPSFSMSVFSYEITFHLCLVFCLSKPFITCNS